MSEIFLINSTIDRLAIWFVMGLLVQAVILIWREFQIRKFFLVVSAASVAGIIGYFGFKDGITPIFDSLIGFCFWFSIFFSLAYKKTILTEIDERQILQINIVFLYVIFFASGLAPVFLIFPSVAALLLVPSIATLAVSFYKKKIPKLAKALFYIWFNVMILILLGYQLLRWAAPLVFGHQSLATLGPWEAFFGGMSILLLSVYSLYMFELLPGKYTGFKDTIEFGLFLAHRHSNRQLSQLEALLIILIQGGILVLNHKFHVVSESMIIGISLAVVTIVVREESIIYFHRHKTRS